MDVETITVGSLFSGAGLCDYGFEQAGFTHRWFCEIAEYPRSVLQTRWPGVPIYDDVREIDGSKTPKVDVLSGGFPCQDVSTGGKRAGIKEGTRSGLWFEFRRIIQEMQPSWVVIENVRGLLSCGIEIVLEDLAAIGYDAEWQVLPAVLFGAPHLRERVFIVAYPHNNKYGDAPRVFTEKRRNMAKHFQSDRKTMWNGVQLDRTGELPRGPALPLPRVHRVADGSSKALDRLRCLGNGIVPAQSRFVAEMIKQAIAHEKTM